MKLGKKVLVVFALALLVALVNSAVAQYFVKHETGIQYVKARRIKVPVGETVYVYTTVRASGGGVSGTLKVEVRKDKVGLPDETYRWFTKSISLSPGEEKEFRMGSFVASDKTGTGWGEVRQYFVKVYFNDQVIWDPTDPNTRECVETYSAGQVQYMKTEFGASEGYPI